jgi:hypothetical protein
MNLIFIRKSNFHTIKLQFSYYEYSTDMHTMDFLVLHDSLKSFGDRLNTKVGRIRAQCNLMG